MDITQELAKKLGISETMAAEQLQRNPSLASIITGQTPPRAMAANAPAADLDEEAQATQRGFSALRELINKNEPGLSPLTKSVEAYPNLSTEKRNQLLSKQYTLEEMTRPEKPSPSSLLNEFKQATQAKETPSAEQSEATIFSPNVDTAVPILTAEAKPTKKPTTLAAVLKAPTPAPVAEVSPSPYEREVASLREERATAKEEQRTEMDRLAKGELASLIGRSLTQIGAAATGMQKGIDMSGVAQKELVDWDKRRAVILSQYEQRVKELEGDRARLERAKERTEDKEERAAIAARQEALAKQERAFKASEAEKDREIKEGIALLKAYRDKDEDAIKKLQGKASLKAKQIDREIATLDKIDGMFELYDAASGSKKGQQEAKIRAALRTAIGPEAVTGEKKSFLGFEYDDKKSVDQLVADVAKYKADLQGKRDAQEQLSLGVEQEAPVEAAPAAQQQQTGTATVLLNGRRGNIPRANLQQFLKDNPEAKVVE
jgi:hypothetical protein